MAKVLTTGRPWVVILIFAIPLLVGNVVQQLYQVTDAFVVGRTLGVDALAAVGATGSLLFLLLGFAWGLTSGFAIPTAQAFGAGDRPAVRRSVATSVLLTAAVSIVLTAVSVAAAGPALELLGTPAELMPQARTFAVVSFAGSTATMFYNYLASAVRAIGDSRTPLVFLAVCCVLNVVLVVALVNGLGLGVGGAAAATVVSQAVSVVLCLEYVRRRIPVLHIARADLRVRRADVLHHLRLGLPMGFQASIIAIGALAVQTRLNGLGTDAVAAYTTGARVDGLGVTLLASLGLAVSTFAAQNHGGGRPDRIRAGVVHGIVISVVGSVLIGVVFVVAGAAIVRGFVGDGEEEVVTMAHEMLVVNGSLYTVLGVLFVLRGALQGLGHTVVPTMTGVVELVGRVGAAVVLGAAFGYAGVVWGNPLAWLFAVLLLVPAYLHARRTLAETPVSADEPVLVEGPAEGSLVVEAVVPVPRCVADRSTDPCGPADYSDRGRGQLVTRSRRLARRSTRA